jgi:hypothetical protein
MAGWRSIAVAEGDGGFLHTCWNENGHRMAAVSADGSIQVWDAVTAATATDSGSSTGLSLTAKWKVPPTFLCLLLILSLGKSRSFIYVPGNPSLSLSHGSYSTLEDANLCMYVSISLLGSIISSLTFHYHALCLVKV